MRSRLSTRTTCKKVNKIIQIEVPPNPYWATIGLTLEPLPLGTGLQIESDISYGYLNHSFQNAVLKGFVCLANLVYMDGK